MPELCKPLRGWWPASLETPPGEVELLGSTFERSLGLQPGVLHYREKVPTWSRHAYVYPNGEYVIDHYDLYNPDMGLMVEHIWYDVMQPTGAVPVTKEQRIHYVAKHYHQLMDKFPSWNSLGWIDKKWLEPTKQYWWGQIMGGYDSMSARKHAIDYYHNQWGRNQGVIHALVYLGEIDNLIRAEVK